MKSKYLSPAKINLSLQVLHKRSDGFHELSSIIQAISLADELFFEESSVDSIVCQDQSIPIDRTNLICRALALFRQKTGLNARYKVHLDKRIPVEAGLGGGSSNAATTLWALNEIHRTNIPDSTLISWGAQLGSDVPFFFSLGSAKCRGRGEIIQEITPPPSQKITIVKPPFGLSTPLVYRHHQPVRNEDHENAILYQNDLEKAAFFLAPKLQELKETLQSCGFENVLMAGSGSSLICFGEGALPSRLSLSTYQAQFLFRPSHATWFNQDA